MHPAFLQEGEQVLRKEPRHPLSAVDAWIGIAVLLLVVVGASFAVPLLIDERALPYAIAASAVAVILAAAWAIVVAFRVRTSLSIITAERVYHAQGRLRFFLAQTTYDRVTDLHVHQSFFGRRLGFGTVVVQTAGHGVHLVGIRDPLGAKRTIEEAREAMVRQLVAAHRPAARATASPTAQAGAMPSEPRLAARGVGGPPVWTGRPTASSMVVPLAVPLLLALPVLVTFLTGAAFVGPMALIAPGLMVLALGLLAVGIVMRLRTTRYEVHPWGVAVATGWIGRSRVEARYEKVTDVAVVQPVLGRMFGFGTIRINTAGGAEAPITFAGVPSPDQVKAIIDDARQGRP